MTRRNSTAQEEEKQTNIVTIGDPKHIYDTDLINNFLDTVFHTEFNGVENVLTWISNGTPQYPIAEDELEKKLKRVPIAKALYFGTSTCRKPPNEDKLYNRKALFERLHVVVLDDIGTKVPVSKLPEALKPTYIIESSKGNYQYG